jgi:hypothetical protein
MAVRSVVVAFLGTCAISWVIAGCGSEPAAPTPAGAEEAAWASLSPGWTKLTEPPFVRARAVSVWTGSELFYWGGDTDYGSTPHADGAAYDPEAGAWERLPPGPLSARSSAGAAWTGTEVLIWGGGTTKGAKGDGAAFKPSSASWRMLPDAPIDARHPVAAVWTGRELIVWGDASRYAASVDGAAYDPAEDRWRRVPPAPFALNVATAVWTGEELIVYGALLDHNNHSETAQAQGIAYDPETDDWRVLPPFPLSPQASTAVWAGDELIVWDYDLRAGAYEPAANRWRELPNLPLRPYECYPQGAEVGDGLVLAWHCGQAALFDVASGQWHGLPGDSPEIFGRAISAGPVALFAGAAHEGVLNALWAYKPAALGALAFVPASEVRGGRVHMSITFPDGTSAVLTYPSELDLAGMGVQPDVSYLYRADRPPRFPLAFYRGEPPAAALQGGGPIVRFRFGAWTVVAPAGDPQEAEVLATSLEGRETSDGFVALEALPPIALSDESGEGGGSRLTIGDTDPDPERLQVDDHFRHIVLWVETCSDEGKELSPSGEYASLCLGGELTANIHGDRKFVEGVFAGLDARDVRPSSSSR